MTSQRAREALFLRAKSQARTGGQNYHEKKYKSFVNVFVAKENN